MNAPKPEISSSLIRTFLIFVGNLVSPLPTVPLKTFVCVMLPTLNVASGHCPQEDMKSRLQRSGKLISLTT